MKSSIDLQQSSPERLPFWRRFLWIVVTLVVALLCVGIVLTKYLGDQKLQEFTLQAESRSLDMQRQDVQLFAIPFAWTVRKELIRSDYGRIEEYFSELIKIKEFGIIMLLDPSGTIKVSTNRKLLGSSFALLYPQLNFSVSKPVSYKLQGGKSMFIVPVMGLNEKIGSIVFSYRYRAPLLP